ncbi:hypothetical protein HK096_007089, partial [Nowakowskiella sp. JEL0078]
MSDNCKRELSFAADEKKHIVPIRLEHLSQDAAILKLITAGKIYIDFTDVNVDDPISLASRIDLLEREVNVLSSNSVLDFDSINKSKTPIEELHSWLNPVNFSDEMSRYSKDFVPGTRSWLLEGIAHWLATSDSSVLWLNGTAGVGKSMMAWLVSTNIPPPSTFGSIFFCRHNDNNKNKALNIITTIAFDIAQKIPQYKDYLYEIFKIDEIRRKNGKTSILQQSIVDVFQKIMLDGLQEIEFQSDFIIIIDALDECGNPHEAQRKELLLVLQKMGKNLRKFVKFIVTGRPELDIWDNLKHLHAKVLSPSDEMNRVDLSIYISSRLSRWIKTSDIALKSIIEALSVKAGGVFIYARLACDQIDQANPKDASVVENIVQNLQSGMDSIYEEILVRAVKEYQNVENLNTVLGTLCALREPLSLSDIANLLQISISSVGAVFLVVRRILNIDAIGNITFIHKSLKDFLTDPQRASDNLFIDIKNFELYLTERCTRTLVINLKPDIIKLSDPTIFLDDVSDSMDRIEKIPAHLKYSIKFWIRHLISSTNFVATNQISDLIFENLGQLVSLKLLNLIEATSLCWKLSEAQKHARDAVRSLQSIESAHLSLFSDSQRSKAIGLLSDFSRLIQRFKIPIEKNPLQVYRSALPFCPINTILRETYPISVVESTLSFKIPRVTVGLDQDWGACLTTFEGHSSDVNFITLSPDCKLLASCSSDSTIRLWNIETSECQILEGHTSSVNYAEFSPDGEFLVSCSNDGYLRIWNVFSGESTLLKGHTNMVTLVKYSPDGNSIISCSSDKAIRLWDINTGESKIFEGHTGTVRDIVISDDGKYIASCSTDKTIRLWNIQTSESRILEGHSSSVNRVLFLPDLESIITCSNDCTILLRNFITGVSRIYIGHTSWVIDLALSPNGKSIVSCSNDNTVRLWDLASGESQIFEGHKFWVNHVEFSPDGNYIVSCSYDNTIHLWDITSGNSFNFEGHTDWVRHVTFTKDRENIISCSNDKTVRIWNLTCSESLNTKISGRHKSCINHVSFSPNGESAVSCSNDETLRVWDLEKGESRKFEGHTGWVFYAEFSHDGKTIASCSADNTVRVWDVASGESKEFTGHDSWINYVSFSLDDQLIVSCSHDKAIYMWNVLTGDSKKFEGHTSSVSHVVFSPDSNLVASCSRDCTVRVWDVKSGEVRVFEGHSGMINKVAFSPDSSSIVSCSEDKSVRIWNLHKNNSRIFEGHVSSVEHVTFSPDGSIVSCSDEGIVIAWDEDGFLRNLEKIDFQWNSGSIGFLLPENNDWACKFYGGKKYENLFWVL